jgi:hypothetical protein
MKKIIFVVYVLFLLSSNYSFSQIREEWTKYYSVYSPGWNVASGLTVDSSGNSAILCYGGNNINYRKLGFACYNTMGNLKWNSIYLNGNNFCEGRDIANDGKQNFYVTGYIEDSTDYDFFSIFKYDSLGNRNLILRYSLTSVSNEMGNVISIDKNQYIYAAGSGYNTTTNSRNLLLIKCNTNGNIIWLRYFTANVGENIFAINLDTLGNIYLAGEAYYGASPNAVVLKYSSNGNLIWSYGYYLDPYQSGAHDMKIDKDGNSYITGYHLDSENHKYLVFKLNQSGHLVWVKNYGDSIQFNKTMVGSEKIALYKNKLFISGYRGIVQIDTNGTINWTDTIRNLTDMTMDNLGNIYTISDYPQTKVIKYNHSVNKLFNLNINSTNIYFIKLDLQKNIYTLSRQTSGIFDNLLLTKYAQTVGIKKEETIIPGDFMLFQNYPNPFNPTTKIKFDISVDDPEGTPRIRGNDNGRRSPTGAFGDDKSGMFGDDNGGVFGDDKLGNDRVVLKVYDILGKEIETLVNEKLNPGTYEVTFNASKYPSGVYFYRLQAGDYLETKKMILLK